MELAEAVGAEQLWGWPVELLDRLLLLQQRAWTGQLSIEQWRAEDAALREGRTPVDSATVEAALTEWVSSGQFELGAHGGLLGRVTVLANQPPSDDDLWVELISTSRRADAEGASPRLAEVDRARRDLIVSWLRPSGSVDAVTGLPWSVIAQHRADSDSVDAARQAALDAADEDERPCADRLATRRADLGGSTGDEWPSRAGGWVIAWVASDRFSGKGIRAWCGHPVLDLSVLPGFPGPSWASVALSCAHAARRSAGGGEFLA